MAIFARDVRVELTNVLGHLAPACRAARRYRYRALLRRLLLASSYPFRRLYREFCGGGGFAPPTGPGFECDTTSVCRIIPTLCSFRRYLHHFARLSGLSHLPAIGFMNLYRKPLIRRPPPIFFKNGEQGTSYCRPTQDRVRCTHPRLYPKTPTLHHQDQLSSRALTRFFTSSSVANTSSEASAPNSFIIYST